MKIKILAVTFIGAILLTAAVISIYENNRDLKTPAVAQQQVFQPQTNENTDSDNDGIMDWEEILYGFDPFNSDSDSDGISDKLEIPKPPLAEKIAPASSMEVTNEPTVVVSQSPTTPTNVPETVNTPQENPLKTYGDDLGSLLTPRIASSVDETTSILVHFSNPSSDSAAKIKVISENYLALSINVSTLHSPDELGDINERLADAYKGISDALLDASKDHKTLSVSKINNYNSTSIELAKTIQTLVTFFKEQNVRFSPSDPGFMFQL